MVASATHAILAQMDMIAAMWRQYLAGILTLAGRSISIKHVVVNPAKTAACVAMAEKFSVYKFNSW